jgi:hypothetical protein
MKSIVIQQTLHGYAEGHRLLDGSIKLVDELARLVLRMSDLSGSNIVSGFEEYLTGYALESANMYAFAKTWYAAEMPRPGCVWTHTLFIPRECMVQIPDLQALTALFVRPQGSNFSKGFSKPIEFEIKENERVILAPSKEPNIQIADLVETLYVQNKDHVLIGTQSSRAYESALICVWSQQWPQLRTAFNFCTGALSARGFGGKPFDVQCTHPSLVRELTSATVAKQSQELSILAKSNQQQPSWITRITEDASKPGGETFRRLLWKFADDPNRKLFGRFARLIDNFLGSSEHNASELLGAVAELFPNMSEASGLKAALFGGRQELPGFKRFEEGEMLLAIASTPHFEAYSSEGLQLKCRGRDLCRLDPKSARETFSRLFRSSVNRLGEDVLAGMIEAINPSMAQAITFEQPQFLPALFRAKPELGISSELWTAAGDHKRELFEAIVLNANLGEAVIEGIVQALLESDSEFLLRRALETWGKHAVVGVFDLLAKGKGHLSERSLGALTFHVESIVTWLLAADDRPQHIIVTAAHIVAPYANQIRQFDSTVWLRTFDNLVKQGNQREANYFAALLLALGLQDAPPDALFLVEECFERVHQIAWDDTMPDDAWVILDPIVPHIWWILDWDRCERLRRGLVEAFVKYHWPPLKLVDCVKNEIFLSRVLESARKVDGGKELISERV